MKNNIEDFCPNNRQEWRKWLEKHHNEKDGIWLIIYKQSSKNPNLTWSEAVDESLCFGWIDSVKKSIDSEKYRQYFTKRKPKSTWSKINKEKIQKLSQEGLMTKSGLDIVEIAKKNGSWSILDSVENLEIPKDLEQEFEQHSGAKVYFLSLSKSVRKMMLYWIVSAKRTETRKKRIQEIATTSGKNEKPKRF
ncbi:YdeI/OmpD-associated family protein [Aureivirga sp. CE67]|uniref:YdeI/OmpD-associated family protein n=1 Tax=Aureivirga sp. CE67 TaxID=1788983 RepID=UPI0018C94810|nr:YdeI/OmpD-associated family protein [Aureivirga sp. CE67]